MSIGSPNQYRAAHEKVEYACLIMVLSSAIIRDRGYINENENAVSFSVMCSNTIVLSIQGGPKKQATTK